MTSKNGDSIVNGAFVECCGVYTYQCQSALRHGSGSMYRLTEWFTNIASVGSVDHI